MIRDDFNFWKFRDKLKELDSDVKSKLEAIKQLKHEELKSIYYRWELIPDRIESVAFVVSWETFEDCTRYAAAVFKLGDDVEKFIGGFFKSLRHLICINPQQD